MEQPRVTFSSRQPPSLPSNVITDIASSPQRGTLVEEKLGDPSSWVSVSDVLYGLAGQPDRPVLAELEGRVHPRAVVQSGVGGSDILQVVPAQSSLHCSFVLWQRGSLSRTLPSRNVGPTEEGWQVPNGHVVCQGFHAQVPVLGD